MTFSFPAQSEKLLGVISILTRMWLSWLFSVILARPLILIKLLFLFLHVSVCLYLCMRVCQSVHTSTYTEGDQKRHQMFFFITPHLFFWNKVSDRTWSSCGHTPTVPSGPLVCTSILVLGLQVCSQSLTC